MRNLTKFFLLIIFIALLITNAYIFIDSISLSNEINDFEKKIGKLKRENLLLENKIDDINSLRYASSIAAQLNFSYKAQPIYLDNLQFARN